MRTATGLHVYTYGHSIIARLDELRAVQMMLNVVKLSAPYLAQSEPGQPGEMTHGLQHPCWPSHSILGCKPKYDLGGYIFLARTVWGLEPISCAGRNQFCACLAGLAPGLMTGWPALTQASH